MSRANFLEAVVLTVNPELRAATQFHSLRRHRILLQHAQQPPSWRQLQQEWQHVESVVMGKVVRSGHSQTDTLCLSFLFVVVVLV